MKNKLSILTLSCLALCWMVFTGCVKKDFDNPPYGGDIDPNLPVNATIADLKAKINANGLNPTRIDQDLTISGIVVADDRSGNFYKQIVLQDETGGIPVLINRGSLYNDYPIGRKVYIRCKGLTLATYGDFIQLGYGIDADGYLSGIPNTFLDDVLVKATYPHDLPVHQVSIAQLNNLSLSDNLLGTFVEIPMAQFVSADIGLDIAEHFDVSSATERTLQDCNDDRIVVRTSGYCNFRTVKIPSAGGVVRGIYTKYRTTPQFIVRDENDFSLKGDRCPFGSSTDTLITIGQLRSMYSGSSLVVNNRRIRGTVISDLQGGDNITSRNMVVQDGDRGIVVRFASSSDNVWAMGDSLEILISGYTLSEFGNLLQIGDQVTVADVQKLGTGSVQPRIASIFDIMNNFESWESTLITIPQATLVSGDSTTYNGKILLNDGSVQNNFIMYTNWYANFANEVAPIGQVKNVTGFLWSTSAEQRISIRNTTDIQ